MKRLILNTCVATAFIAILTVSCKEKKNDAITPTYRSQSTGTGANPMIKTVKKAGNMPVLETGNQGQNQQ